MRQPLNLLSVQSSINCCTDQDRHPPTKWSQEKKKKGKEKQNLCWDSQCGNTRTRKEESAECLNTESERQRETERERTGRIHMSTPIGVRGRWPHLPKQTAWRSGALHLSLLITPLSRPPVSQSPCVRRLGVRTTDTQSGGRYEKLNCSAFHSWGERIISRWVGTVKVKRSHCMIKYVRSSAEGR